MPLKAKKLLQGLAVALAVVVVPGAMNPAFLLTPQAWTLVATGIIASLFQPAYNPFGKSPDKRDRGTANQIIWSIYLTQLAVVVEAACFRYPDSVAWNMSTSVAFILMAAGLIIRTWAVFELGEFFTWHISARRGQAVVRTGPYKYIRHPGYAGAFLTYASSAIFLHAWHSLAPAVIILCFAFARRIRYEEQELAKEIGKPYVDYCKETKRVIPWVW